MIILIKYNNTSSKYLPTYQFLGTIGRQVGASPCTKQISIPQRQISLGWKNISFSPHGENFPEKTFPGGIFCGIFFTPWEILMFSFRGYILAFTLAKCSWPLSLLLLTLLVEISLPRLNISGKKKFFCLPIIPTQPKQYKVSTYILQVQVFMFIFIIIHLQPLQVHRRVIWVPIRQVFYVYLSVLRQLQ